MDYINLAPNQDIDENGLVFDLGNLYAYLRRVSDNRKVKGKVYSLGLLLVLMILAKLRLVNARIFASPPESFLCG